MEKTVFDTLMAVNVNDKTEKKTQGGAELTYLSWPFAWGEVKKRYPDAHYEIERFNGLPYVQDPQTGYMVFTTVTIQGVTHEMWLPVMDGANNAMKAEPYTVKTKYKEIAVRAATMMDINKAIMRCLVKNLAMFGMGLYIYAGEDLPIPEIEAAAEKKAAEEKEAEAKRKEEEEKRTEVIEKIKAVMIEKGYVFSPKAQKQLRDMDLTALEIYLENLIKMPHKQQKEQKEEKIA